MFLSMRRGLVGAVKFKANFSCSDHKIIEFVIPRAVTRTHSRLTSLDFRRADFELLKDVLSRVPLDKALHRTGA